ncbi:MAG: ribonuclease Y [Phycisphaerae bacterium]|nr:ribonuclease Y [Phycisphaerae bacterium]
MQTALLLGVTDGWIPAIAAFFVGGVLAFVVVAIINKSKQTSLKQTMDTALEEARRTGENIVRTAEVEAKAEYLQRLEQFNKETAETRAQSKEAEKRLDKREDNLEKKLDTLSVKEKKIDQAEAKLAEQTRKLAVKEKEINATLERQRETLTKISGMSTEEAKELLLSSLESEVEHEAATLVDRLMTEAKDSANAKARDVILTAIQRYAAEHTCDSTVSTVDIPSDDMKGRVIGREGRNIRSFEKATGVDVIVDDTPGVVVVSAFDPVRREVARQSLERLIQDGRIHPARIEELVEDTRKEIEREIIETGKKAAVEANVSGLHRKQIDLLGRLKYRTSYGQNVLQHSIEVAYLCQIMAAELGLDGRLARRCGLLHDIGKAVDHEVEGGHPQIGADICKRFNERPEVLNAIAGHHGDVDPISPYCVLAMAADAISASRPGSRRESLERYVQRLQQMEEIATSCNGVRQAYAIQAGRELRVMVDCNRVSDAQASKIARDIAKQVEEAITYPGEVKVTVLRELRVVEIAR